VQLFAFGHAYRRRQLRVVCAVEGVVLPFMHNHIAIQGRYNLQFAEDDGVKIGEVGAQSLRLLQPAWIHDYGAARRVVEPVQPINEASGVL